MTERTHVLALWVIAGLFGLLLVQNIPPPADEQCGVPPPTTRRD